MATESEFRTLATNLRQTAQDLVDASADLERERDYLRLESPTIRLLIDATYTESAAQLTTLAGTADSIADEFDRRAEVCREYAEWKTFYDAAWVKYHNREIEVRPQFRSKPAPWVEV